MWGSSPTGDPYTTTDTNGTMVPVADERRLPLPGEVCACAGSPRLPSDVFEVLVDQLSVALVAEYQEVVEVSVHSPRGTNRGSTGDDPAVPDHPRSLESAAAFVSCSTGIR